MIGQQRKGINKYFVINSVYRFFHHPSENPIIFFLEENFLFVVSSVVDVIMRVFFKSLDGVFSWHIRTIARDVYKILTRMDLKFFCLAGSTGVDPYSGIPSEDQPGIVLPERVCERSILKNCSRESTCHLANAVIYYSPLQKKTLFTYQILADARCGAP